MFELPNGGKAVMIGSLIQQNFGETINYHGYGIYDAPIPGRTIQVIYTKEPTVLSSGSDVFNTVNVSIVTCGCAVF